MLILIPKGQRSRSCFSKCLECVLHLRVTSAFDDDGFWLARATVQMFDLRKLQVT